MKLNQAKMIKYLYQQSFLFFFLNSFQSLSSSLPILCNLGFFLKKRGVATSDLS